MNYADSRAHDQKVIAAIVTLLTVVGTAVTVGLLITSQEAAAVIVGLQTVFLLVFGVLTYKKGC